MGSIERSRLANGAGGAAYNGVELVVCVVYGIWVRLRVDLEKFVLDLKIEFVFLELGN